MSSALLVMDMQQGTLSRVAADKRPALIAATQRAIAAARAAKAHVIYVCLHFRPGYPEVSPNNLMFSGLKTMGAFTDALGSDIPSELAPQPGDLVIAKHRVSAFSGNGLEQILRAQGVIKLALCGIATSGIVLSTARQAMDLDFQCIVVPDACADMDDEVHRVLVEKVFAKHNKIVASAELAAAL